MDNKENISRSSIFRSKMKMEASKRIEEMKEKESSREKKLRSKYFYTARRINLSKKSIGREPGE